MIISEKESSYLELAPPLENYQDQNQQIQIKDQFSHQYIISSNISKV